MDSLDTLPQDLLIKLFDDFLDDHYISHFMLSCTSHKFYRIVSHFAISKQIPRKLECLVIASQGYLSILQLAREIGCPWQSDVCVNAAIIGRLDIIEWAVSHGCQVDYHTIDNAAKFGHLDIIKWARRTTQICYLDRECETAACYGHLNIVKWVTIEQHVDINYTWDTYDTVVENGFEDMLQLLLGTDRWLDRCLVQRIGDESSRICATAALHGHLKILQLLRERGFNWNMNICKNAVMSGHLEVLKWARDNGCRWDSDTELIAKEKWGDIF